MRVGDAVGVESLRVNARKTNKDEESQRIRRKNINGQT